MHSCNRHSLNIHSVHGIARPGGAGCAQTTLNDVVTHDPPEAVKPTLQEQLATEASTHHSLPWEQKEVVHLRFDHNSCSPTPVDRLASAQRKEGACPNSHSKFNSIARTEVQVLWIPVLHHIFSLATLGLSRKGVLNIFPQFHGPRHPAHKPGHRPKTIFTSITMILVTLNVHSMRLDYLYSLSISGICMGKSSGMQIIHFLPLIPSCLSSHVC